MSEKLSGRLQNAIFKYQTYIPTDLHSELLAIAEGVDKDLEAKLSKMEEKLLSVLEVAVARGEKLGYEDADYRKDLAELEGEIDDRTRNGI